MIKYVIAVAFISSVALSVNAEGEWDEDAQQYCVQTCESYCENCTEPARCGEGEKKCGEQPIDPNMSQCSTDDICVPDNCECDYMVNGKVCPRICAVNCTDEQIKCGQPLSADGCRQNDICIHKGFDETGLLCDGVCPVECEDGELLCSEGVDERGCANGDDCKPKQKSHDSLICPQQQCPLECEDSKHLCEGDVDVHGCKENDVCELRDVSSKGVLCPGTCPVTCNNGEVKCTGVIDYSDTDLNGCPGQDICHVKAKNENGVYCPPDSASHLCPKACPPNEVLCEPYEGPLGCKGPYECHPRSKDDMDEYCPSTADCPVHCKPNEFNCPQGDDESGCKLPDECVEKERGFDGELCPFHCPEVCNDEQLFCAGGIDESGCQGPSQCRDKEQHKWGPGAESEPKQDCPGYCPATCQTHEILCPSQLDPCNGCPTEEVCREAIKDKTGIFCPGKEEPGKDAQDTSLRRGGHLSFSHNCPKLCREQEGEVLCPTYESENGCKPEAECKLRVADDNGDWCPSHSVCDKQCPKGYLLCQYEDKDSKGCKVEPICVYRGKNNIDLYCAGHCPPICSAGQTLVSGDLDADGCELPATCKAEE